MLVVCNFTPIPRFNYRLGVPAGGLWREALNSDALVYGGSGVGNLGSCQAHPMRYHGRPYSLCLTLPPLAVLFLEHAAPPRTIDLEQQTIAPAKRTRGSVAGARKASPTRKPHRK